MKIVSVKVWSYSNELASPIYVKGNQLMNRSGLFISLFLSDGSYGIGEISPLPGFSQDTLEMCKSSISDLIGFLLSKELELSLGGCISLLSDLHTLESIPVSVEHGVGMALMQLISYKRQISISTLLNPNAKSDISFHGLLVGSLSDILSQYETLTQYGFNRFKLKVGQLSTTDEIDRLNGFLSKKQSDHIVWLDANRQWTLQVASDICTSIDSNQILYVEEPVELESELDLFFDRTGIRYGLDETIILNPDLNMSVLRGLNVFILKPMCLGLRSLIDYYNSSKDTPIDISISSIYETSLTHRYYCHLSAAFSKHHSVGIDAVQFLEFCNRSIQPNFLVSDLSLSVQSELSLFGSLYRW